MMRQLILSTAVMLASQVVRADSSLTLPWDEFKTLYTEKIQQQFDQNKPASELPSLMSIDEAHYKVSINGTEALVDVTIQGKHLQGKVEPIRLFDHQVAISQINTAEGGAIISDDTGYLFYLDKQLNNKTFLVNLSLVISLSEDRQSQKLAFAIPSAVRNVLDVELPLETELIEYPGIQQSLQRYYFSPAEQLNLRFANTQQRHQQLVDIDTFTQIALDGDKYIFTLHGVSDQFSRQDVELQFPPALRYLDSSLPAARLKPSGLNKLQINTGNTEGIAFVIRFEADAKENLSAMSLPRFVDNTAPQDSFQIIEPIAAQISLAGKDLQRDVASSRLPLSLRSQTQINGVYQKVGDAGTFNLKLHRFDEVQAPDIVLDELFFYTSFAENGNEISVLRMQLPDAAGDRLILKPIPNTEVWSLLVNGKKQEVFTRKNNENETVWVLPLASNSESIIELTYLQKHKKLGLEGSLPILIPETGLAAQKVFVTVGLTDRVELVAVEGELTPAEDKKCPVVQSFSGKPYLFKYPFYRGDSMQAAIFYKEPLEQG